ncbi:hypothetical protein JZ751_009848, partial [Albula glossodonta]
MLPNEVATEQQSLIVVKKLLAIAVSCITYLRGLFPEKAYGSKYVEEQKVMILREERSCPGASQIVQWMHGCFDALQKKYKVTECYQFKIQYTDKGAQMEIESRSNNKVAKMACGNVRKASILLVRKLYTLMQNLGPLPDSVCLNMKLSYYDEVTPQEYQPPGFKEGDSDSMMFEKEPVKLTMGEVVTPFHTLRVDVTTERERLEQVSLDQNSYFIVDGEESVGRRERAALKMDVEERASVNNTQPINKIDSLVRKTSDLEVTLKRTRSGRVIKSTVERKDTKVCGTSKSRPNPQQVSQFIFPANQDNAPAPKRRKF